MTHGRGNRGPSADAASGQGKETFGPAIAIYESLAGRPEQVALDRAFSIS